MILSFINNKGGVAKTTTAVSTGAALAAKGLRVLLVDLDAQASASLSLGLERGELEPGCAEVLFEGLPATDAIHETATEGLELLPGSMALASADLNLGAMEGRENRLKAALRPLRRRYDAIVLDCPPSLSLLTVNCLVASDGFVVPVVPEYLALEGLVNLFEAIERIEAGIGVRPKHLGILLTLVDRRRGVTDEIVGLIRGHYRKEVFRTVIPENVKLSEAPSFGRSIFAYAKSSRGAEAYKAFAKELRKRCRKEGLTS